MTYFGCNQNYKFIWLDDWYIYGSEADGRIATVDPYEIKTTAGIRGGGVEFPTALNYINSPPDSIQIPSAMWKSNIDGISAKYQTQQRIPDFRRYEVKDHLGNVRTVISDIKNPFSTSGQVSNWTYLADIKNISNTYPYGKSYGTNAIYNAVDEYRYGFNGMEKEKNISSSGNTFDFGARVYDSEFPTFLSRDPLEAEFAYQSSYVFAGNTPIQAIDENGTRKRVVHLFNVEFDKGEYTVTQLPNYERQDGKSPKNSYGTDEMQYHFNGNFYDDIYKVPGYQFAFDQKVGPMRKTIGSIVDITVGVLLAIATKGEAKAGNLFSRYLFSNAMYQISVNTIEMIENDRDKFPTNLGGVVGLTLDFTVGNETKSIQGYLELGDEMLMWRPRKIPDESLDKINYGISLYNVFDKSTADEFLKQMKSDLYYNNFNKSNSSSENSKSNKSPTGSEDKGKTK